MDNKQNPSAADAPPTAAATGDKPSTEGHTPVTPEAAAASAGTVASPAPGAPAARSVPSETKPAARVPAASAAAKVGTTPTPSVSGGVSKAVAAKTPAAAAKKPAAVAGGPPADPPINKSRRRIVWLSVAGFLGTSFLMFLRFFLPRAIFEPSSVFRIGTAGDYSLGVDDKLQQQYRVWVVKTSDRLFVINAVCTHLGCTPDWKSSENKFKCPCHGSGYDFEGVNFEGPAPRPMDRAHVELDAEGQIVVNKDRLYKWPKGETNEFNEPGAYIPL